MRPASLSLREKSAGNTGAGRRCRASAATAVMKRHATECWNLYGTYPAPSTISNSGALLISVLDLRVIGGRTRTRTWDPLIKSDRITVLYTHSITSPCCLQVA
jgi:hypothetical protein